MKYKLTLISLLTLVILPLFGFEVGLGYRQDNLSWTIKDPSPLDMEMQEKWKINANQLSVKEEKTIGSHIYLRGYFDYAWVNNGRKAIDQFFTGSSPSLDKGWLKAHSKGQLYDISGCIGCKTFYCQDLLVVTPLFGYSWHRQRFKDENYKDVTNNINIFKEAQGSYSYLWKGPWVGAQLALEWTCLKLYGEYQYHWGRYHAKVDDRFFDGVAIEKQNSTHVHGNDASLGATIDFTLLSVGVCGNYKYWVAKKGSSKTKESAFQLRHVCWKSAGISLTLSTIF